MGWWKSWLPLGTGVCLPAVMTLNLENMGDFLFSPVLEFSKKKFFLVISMTTFVIRKKSYLKKKIRQSKLLKFTAVNKTCLPSSWTMGWPATLVKLPESKKPLQVWIGAVAVILSTPFTHQSVCREHNQPEAVSYFFKIDTWKALMPAPWSQRYQSLEMKLWWNPNVLLSLLNSLFFY